MTEWLYAEEKAIERQQKAARAGNGKAWALLTLVLTLATVNAPAQELDKEQAIQATCKLLKQAYTKTAFDDYNFRQTANAMETADVMRKLALQHYAKSIEYLDALPAIDIKDLLKESIKESIRQTSSNPRDRLLSYVTAMSLELMTKYGYDVFVNLSNFTYSVIQGATLMESAEEVTKIAPSLMRLYNDDYQHYSLCDAVEALVKLDLYTYSFISPKDGSTVSSFFKSIREEFFKDLKVHKQVTKTHSIDLLIRRKHFNLICLCLENTPREFAAEIIDLARNAAEELFYFESDCGIKHYYFDKWGEKCRAEEFSDIEFLIFK